MQRDRQLVQTVNEGAREIDDDLLTLAPGQAFDSVQIYAAILIS
jgi:hypothetical protein